MMQLRLACGHDRDVHGFSLPEGEFRIMCYQCNAVTKMTPPGEDNEVVA